jgi:arylsulfatase A-like enzyme
VRSIRESRYKLAEYYDPSGKRDSQWEMYDLKRDPLERKNLTAMHYRRTSEEERQYLRLRHKLARVRATRLRPLAARTAVV